MQQMPEEHGNMTPAVDIIYSNGILFMMTTSRAVHFSPAQLITI